MEHWYGLPEAMFENQLIQRYPADYIYQNEQDRFGEAGRLWQQSAKPGSEKWNSVMETLLERDFGMSPTFNAYVATRDVMRQARAKCFVFLAFGLPLVALSYWSNYALRVGFAAIIISLVPLLCGVWVFRGEQEGKRFRYLAECRVTPQTVWLSKQCV